MMFGFDLQPRSGDLSLARRFQRREASPICFRRIATVEIKAVVASFQASLRDAELLRPATVV
jgi:hypothetical protein